MQNIDGETEQRSATYCLSWGSTPCRELCYGFMAHSSLCSLLPPAMYCCCCSLFPACNSACLASRQGCIIRGETGRKWCHHAGAVEPGGGRGIRCESVQVGGVQLARGKGRVWAGRGQQYGLGYGCV